METKAHHAAFAQTDNRMSDEGRGLSKREYFAALAMQGMLANSTAIKAVADMQAEGKRGSEYFAGSAIELADALIAMLNGGKL